ncbi:MULTISPECIES: hypothetical protein [Luteibacter]|uniref:hypothetical protein n=1 Tax=Luteibacter sp. dw_328 TaxID=2719796 RepID=UPI0012FB3276|nr:MULTISPECIES: hypothetical protein [Luteibacter]
MRPRSDITIVQGNAMANAPIYQIAFMFVFNQDFTNQKVQLNVADSNDFLVTDSQTAQLEAYSGNTTPPLLNFSVSGKQVFFNVSDGKTYGGMQALVWSSFTAGSPPTLQLDLAFSSGLITATYNVPGGSASGQLVSGRNTITIGK